MSNNRYKIVSEWFDGQSQGSFTIQVADIQDTRGGHVYSEGAHRVVVTATGKPAKVGKGGTVPFMGECAWSDAQRLLGDLAIAERFAR